MLKLKFSGAQAHCNVKRQFSRYRRFALYSLYFRWVLLYVRHLCCCCCCCAVLCRPFYQSIPSRFASFFLLLLLHLFLFWLQNITSTKITYLLKHEIWFIISSSSIYHRKAYRYMYTLGEFPGIHTMYTRFIYVCVC